MPVAPRSSSRSRRSSSPREAGLLRATTSAAEAIKASRISLVCVGTPSQANDNLDLKYMQLVCEEIGDALREKDGPHVVLIRSTMLPGTTEDVLMPILEKHSGKKVGEGFDVCDKPGFLRKEVRFRLYSPTNIVVGEYNAGSGDTLLALCAGIDAPVILQKRWASTATT